MENQSQRAGRPWLFGALFIWALVGSVSIAAYSSRTTPPSPGADPNDHPDHPGHELHAKSGSIAGSAENALPKAKTTEIAWADSFENAMRRARTEKKPILIDFYTDWCAPCKEMDQTVWPDQTVVEEARHWVTIKINAEKRPDVADAYGVRGYPTIVFAASSGKPITIVPGFADAPEMLKTLRDSRDKWENSAQKPTQDAI